MFCNKTLPAQKKFGKFCGALARNSSDLAARDAR